MPRALYMLGYVAGRTAAGVTWPYHALRGKRRRRPRRTDGRALSRALADPDARVRARAIEVISEFSSERAGRVLSTALHDPDAGVRCAALDAVARLRPADLVLAAILALDDPDEHVRQLAARAVEATTGHPVDHDEVDDPDRRKERIGELRAWWKQERLEQLLTAANVAD